MSLTNSQHDAIMRIYGNIQTRNRHIHDERVEEVYAACPRIPEIENEIIDLSARSAPIIIRGDEGAMEEYRCELARLNNEHERLLAVSGFPKDYLAPIYDCPVCHDTGLADGRQCACFKKKVVDMFYMRSNLKNIVASENFGTFSFDWYSKTDIDKTTGLSSYDNMDMPPVY